MSIHAALHQQFDATFRATAAMIDQIPDEHFASGDVDYLIPARHVLHIINTAHGYCRDQMDGRWNELTAAHFGNTIDWEGTPTCDLPSKEQLREYLDHVASMVRTWLDDQSEADLLWPQTMFQWTGPNLLSRCVYVIRHTQGHLQEINAELRRRGLPRVAWQA